MIHDSTAKASFEDESLENFWVMEKAYPKVVKKPLTLLTVFPSTYLCESAVVAIKTKAHNRLLCQIYVVLYPKLHLVFHQS